MERRGSEWEFGRSICPIYYNGSNWVRSKWRRSIELANRDRPLPLLCHPDFSAQLFRESLSSSKSKSCSFSRLPRSLSLFALRMDIYIPQSWLACWLATYIFRWRHNSQPNMHDGTTILHFQAHKIRRSTNFTQSNNTILRIFEEDT